MMIEEATPSPDPIVDPAAVTPKMRPKGATPTIKGASATMASLQARRAVLRWRFGLPRRIDILLDDVIV